MISLPDWLTGYDAENAKRAADAKLHAPILRKWTFILCVLIPVLVLGSQPVPLAAPVAPVKKSFLTWNRDGKREWKVYTGPARGAWTNAMFTSTNFIPYQQGIAYGVSSWDAALNQESRIINYPSNRVAQLVIEARNVDTGRVMETNWLVYTNAAAGAGKLLRLREDFVRWD